MTPANVCIQAIDAASKITDSTVAARVDNALDVLEASCRTPTDRVFALESVHGTFARRRRSLVQAAFGRFVASRINAHQNKILLRA